MRFVVLLFGFLGVVLTGIIGAGFIFFDPEFLPFIRDNQIDKQAKDLAGIDLIEFVSASPMGTSHGDTGLFLCIAAVYGLLGTLMSFCRYGWQGALLMLIPVICTSIMNPYTAAFTGLLAFAGLLSFLVFPLPINAPKAKDDSDQDEDDED
jgi:hypothetical protein